jgi:RNA-directed DNA polymerase
MNQTEKSRYKWEWSEINWKSVEKAVFKLQKRIYQASLEGNNAMVKKLQRLLKSSHAAKLLSVRKVTLDNEGKNTPGVDGKTISTDKGRQLLTNNLRWENTTKPIRRVWIEKANKIDKRPLGIPTIRERVRQNVIKIILEPEWEAKFEANSYGFRPGRSCHDAIQAIFQSLKFKQAYILDADIKGCFDNINHHALLKKLNTAPSIRKIIRIWLKAGVMDTGKLLSNEKGVHQGGGLSPLLANIALHGLENDTKEHLRKDLLKFGKSKSNHQYPKAGKYMHRLSIIRYADDFVVIHENREVVLKANEFIREWLKNIGLELNHEKTHILHSLNATDGKAPGFDFLGFNVRQFICNDRKKGYKLIIKPSQKAIREHGAKMSREIRKLRGVDQASLIRILNPIIRGWCNYYQYVVSRLTFEKLEDKLFRKIWGWACFNHNRRNKKWIKKKYFIRDRGNNWRFGPQNGHTKLIEHTDWKITRFIKVQGFKSPYDGDFIYWATRMGKYGSGFQKAATILKKQTGRCFNCKLYFKSDDIYKLHFADGDTSNYALKNIFMIHDHCTIQQEVFMTRTRLLRSRMR